MAFLTPSGPHRVGSILHQLIDDDRESHIGSGTPGRKLFLKCWYPARASAGSRGELIWQQLRRDALTPFFIRALLKFSRTRTATHTAAKLDEDAAKPQPVLYNHGLVSFASENTSLAEDLASHGYVIIAIQHAEQLAEFKALNAGQPPERKRLMDQLTQALRNAKRAEKAELAVAYYEASTNTNRIVVGRSSDASFVLDHLDEIWEKIPGGGAHSLDTASVHLVGVSVGGAVSTETARRDPRAIGVVNLDGGMHGILDREDLRQPYLMMYSAANEGVNDVLLPKQTQRSAPAGTAHLNYHDIAVLVPALRLTGALGRIDPKSFLQIRNRIVLEFCNAKGG
jgi:dienelactone hydrolase